MENYEVLESSKKHMGMKKKNAIINTIIYIVLIGMSIFWILPFIFILLESFRYSPESLGQVGYILPHKFSLGNYKRLFEHEYFMKWYGNTLLVALIESVAQTAVVLCVSFALSRIRFNGRKLLMNICLVLGMFPGFLTLVVLYNVLQKLGLTGEHAIFGLMLVGIAGSGTGYYVTKGYFDTIPYSLDEAAKIDGASKFQVFWKVIMPLSKPIVIYALLTAFLAPWGEFMFASYLGRDAKAGWTVAVGLQWMMQPGGNIDQYYTMFCAGGILVSIPVTVLFLFLQKYYVEGVTGGAVKG